MTSTIKKLSYLPECNSMNQRNFYFSMRNMGVMEKNAANCSLTRLQHALACWSKCMLFAILANSMHFLKTSPQYYLRDFFSAFCLWFTFGCSTQTETKFPKQTLTSNTLFLHHSDCFSSFGIVNFICWNRIWLYSIQSLYRIVVFYKFKINVANTLLSTVHDETWHRSKKCDIGNPIHSGHNVLEHAAPLNQPDFSG